MISPKTLTRLAPAHLWFLLLCLLSVAVSWTSCNALVRLSLHDERYTHLVVVPIVTLGVLCLEKARIFGESRYCPAVGVPLLLLGLVVYFCVEKRLLVAGSLTLAVVALVILWMGAFILSYGLTSFRKAAFPLFFLFLIVPLPAEFLAKIVRGLQSGSAEVTYRMFHLAGVPVLKDGVTLSLPGVEINIAPECSGIRSSFALVMAGMLAGHALLRLTSRQILLAMCLVPIVILKNAVRIFCISMLGIYVDQRFFYGDLHHRGGAVFAALALLILVPLLVLLQKSEASAANHAGRTSRWTGLIGHGHRPPSERESES
ncbi:MAG: exosortase/archaeosortase family protein [Bryobacteraceae bacterium]|jgi:exosortase